MLKRLCRVCRTFFSVKTNTRWARCRCCCWRRTASAPCRPSRCWRPHRFRMPIAWSATSGCSRRARFPWVGCIPQCGSGVQAAVEVAAAASDGRIRPVVLCVDSLPEAPECGLVDSRGPARSSATPPQTASAVPPAASPARTPRVSPLPRTPWRGTTPQSTASPIPATPPALPETSPSSRSATPAPLPRSVTDALPDSAQLRLRRFSADAQTSLSAPYPTSSESTSGTSSGNRSSSSWFRCHCCHTCTQ